MFTSWSIIPGVIIVLFFRCMSALLNTVNRRKGGINWGLVAHAVAMFSLMTVYSSVSLAVAYIDKREYPGDRTIPPGPVGYQASIIDSSPTNLASNIMFCLNMWLADGLLVSSVEVSVIQVPDTSRFSSIVVMLFML